ncbi:MAG: lysozyme inhibitor LprI family protein [Ramlibacter sp.]
MAFQSTLGPILAAVSVAGLSSAALAASFDCTKASTAVEKLICESPTLNALDEESAKLYTRLIESTAGAERDSYRASQREWLKNERNRCTSAECVAREISQRSGMLRTTLERTRVKVSDIAEVAPNALAAEQMLARERKPAPAAPAPSRAEPQPEPRGTAPAPAPAPAQAQAAAPGRVPRNPSDWVHCTRADLSAAQFQICEAPAIARLFKELDQKLGTSLRHLEKLKASSRRAGTDKVVAPALALWSKPEAACPALDADCLRQATEEATRKAEQIATALEAQWLPLQKAADDRYFQQKDTLPLVITNGGGGNKPGNSGGYFTHLSVTNQTSNAYSEIAVACGLYETWGDEKSVEPEFNHTIRAGIAPKSRTLSLPYVAVPWDLSKWDTDAQVIKCRVLSTKAASAAEAQAATEKNQAETALIRQRTEAAMKSWDEERERNKSEQSANQLVRLNQAIASFKRTPQCNAYGDIIAQQRSTVLQYQRAGQSGYSIVQSLINEARRMGCL